MQDWRVWCNWDVNLVQIQGISIKDCQGGDKSAKEVDNKDGSMNHMPDLWKLDVVDNDISRRTTKLT